MTEDTLRFEAWEDESASSRLFLVLAPDAPRFTVVAASRGYRDAAGLPLCDLVGRGIFDVLSANVQARGGCGFDNLRASLEAVVRRGAVDFMAPRPGVLARAPEVGAGDEGRWWCVRNVPALGSDGQLRHIIHQLEDATEVVRLEQAAKAARDAERRWAFQVRLGDAPGNLTSPVEVQARACRMLGEHLEVNRAHFSEIEGDEFIVRASYANGLEPFRGRGPVSMFGRALVESFRRAEPALVNDVDRDPRLTGDERSVLRAAGIAAFAASMLTREGRWAAALAVHSAAPRVWTEQDVATLTDVADRIWNASERMKAEAALRESEARYFGIFEKSPIGIALTRMSDRVIVSANPAFLRTFEYAADEILGKTTTELGISTPDVQARMWAMLGAQQPVRDVECVRTAKSGAQRILSVSLDLVMVNGKEHALTMFRDLTALRAAEQASRDHEQQRQLSQHRAETLRRSESRYAGILQTSADAIISVDEQQRITLFNSAAEHAFGYAAAEVIGAPLDILFPDRFQAADAAHVTRFAAGDQTTRPMSQARPSVFGRRKDGEEFPLEATISKVTVDGETTLTAVLRDVTSRVRDEIEQRLLSDVNSALSLRIDDELALTTLNRLVVRELADLSTLFLVGEDGSIQRHGIEVRDPARQWLKELMMDMPLDRRAQHPIWEILEARRSLLLQLDAGRLPLYALNEDHTRALGAIGPRSVLGVPLLVGSEVAGVLFLAACRPSRAFDDRDVELLEEIARHAALKIENARLYRAAQKAIRARDEVLSIVAHDLRAPLGSILMYARLPRRHDDLPERRAQASATAIERSAAQMNRLINDLLDVTRMEAGHLDLERAPMAGADLIAQVLAAHKEAAMAQLVELREEVAPELPAVWADGGRIVQVIDNLLGNALRVTERGRITIGAKPRRDEVLFWVADTGSGIAAHDLPHVFDRFWQARQTRRGGAGLGLAIVKAIVEAHGGRVWLESALDVGTTAFFTLPRAPVRDGRARSVLVVEDDRELLEQEADLLRRHGYEVTTAENGLEALEHLRRAPRPSVVILDLAMPVMDGWAFLDERNRDPALRSLPAIVVSGRTDIADRVATARAHFARKPLKPETLLKLVEELEPADEVGP